MPSRTSRPAPVGLGDVLAARELRPDRLRLGLLDVLAALGHELVGLGGGFGCGLGARRGLGGGFLLVGATAGEHEGETEHEGGEESLHGGQG